MQNRPAQIIPPKAPRAPKADAKRRRALRRWFGRPSAAQSRLLEQLLAALVVDFEEKGAEAIETLRDSDPLNYLRLVVGTVRNTQLDVNAGRRFNDDDVYDALAKLDQIAARYSLDLDGLHAEPAAPLQTPGLPALPEAG